MYKQSLDSFLSWLGKTLHLDTKYFAKTSFLNSVQQTIGVIAGLTISYFFGHFTSKKLFGDYNLILSVLGFLTIITLPGLDDYLTRSIAQGYDTSYLRAVKVKFFLSLLCTPILIGFSLFYFSQNQQPLAISFLLIAFLFPLLPPLQLFNEFFTAKMNFKNLTILLSFSSILTAILVSSVILLSQSLVLIMLGYILGVIIPSLLGYVISLRYVKKNNKNDPELIRFAVFMTLLLILPWSSAYLGMIVLGTFLGSELLAVFVVANKIPTYVQKNLFVFYKPLTAKLAQQTNKQHLETLKMHSLKLILWGIILALIIYLFSPLIIKFIFTDKYKNAIPYAQVLSLAVIPLPISWVLADILSFQKIKKPRLYSTMAINLIKIISYLVVIPLFKLSGLVAIYIIERYINMIVNFLIIRRVIKISK